MSRSISVCLLAFAAICASIVLASAQVTPSPTESNSIQAPCFPRRVRVRFQRTDEQHGQDQRVRGGLQRSADTYPWFAVSI